MSEQEAIVGATRRGATHLARLIPVPGSSTWRIAILHSQQCIDAHPPGVRTQECPYRRAADRGVELDDWHGYEDKPVSVALLGHLLFPVSVVNADRSSPG